jgi:hypothetical protein
MTLADKFTKWADALQAKIDHASRPMGQNPTPKRNREYQSRLHDARNLERFQKALYTLAEGHKNNSLPAALASLSDRETIRMMVYKSTTGGGGYYSVIECDDFSRTDPDSRLLQELISGNPAEQAERERLRKIGTIEAEIALSNIPGFFPTPPAVVELMLQRAHIGHDMKVLEPSAGSGNIADAVKSRMNRVQVYVCEVNPRLQELLKLKGYSFAGYDCLDLEPEFNEFERVAMNPPFENGQDMKHVRHAYKLLSPNGILVSIMAPGFEFRGDRQAVEFREWMESVGATVESLPDGSFKSSGTGVGTRLVVIEKD